MTSDMLRKLVATVASLYPAPLGIEEAIEIGEIADRRMQKLPGSQTRRVRVAIVLVSDAELLVLDEPTVVVDVEGRHAFWSTMRASAARGKAWPSSWLVQASHVARSAPPGAPAAGP